MVGERSRCVVDSEVKISFVVESADDTAKRVGPEGKQDVVVSTDDIAKQVGSEGKHTNVGRMDRWKRVANGKGKGQVKRDLDAISGRGSCRKLIGVHETEEEKRED